MRRSPCNDNSPSLALLGQRKWLADVAVFVIEPDELQRRQICDNVASIPGMAVVGDSPFPDQDVSEAAPDLVLINSSLLHANMRNLQALSQDRKGLRLIFFSARACITTLLDAGNLPVCGLLSFNHLTTEEFTRSLVTIALGGAVIEPVSTMELLAHLRRRASSQPTVLATQMPLVNHLPITIREAEVLACVREGLANKEIATSINMSVGTVRAHLRSIFNKLEVTSRTGAAMVTDEQPQPRRTSDNRQATPLASTMARPSLYALSPQRPAG